VRFDEIQIYNAAIADVGLFNDQPQKMIVRLLEGLMTPPVG
jgi:hypothetical protein